MDPHVHAYGSPEEQAELHSQVVKSMSKFSGMLPLLGITEETIPGVESTYMHFLKCFDNHLKTSRYLLGDAPCAGDFGLVGPLYAHLYRDPVPGKEMKIIAPRVAEWVERVQGGCFPGPEDVSAGFPADDAVADTLVPLLELFFKEHWPWLSCALDTFSEVAADLDPEKEIQRPIGQKPFVIGGCEGTRLVQAFEVWKSQRVLDCVPGASAWLSGFPNTTTLLKTAERLAGRPVVRKETVKPNKKSTLYLINSKL